MKRISIGSWAYTIGPYEDRPVDFDTVCRRLAELGFDGVELGGFPPHPNPDDLPERSQREEVAARVREQGGHPIGRYQAVSHRIVTMKERHERARLFLLCNGGRRQQRQ